MGLLVSSFRSDRVDAAPAVLESKKKRYDDYSDNGAIPVWLAIFITDTISGTGMTAIQTLREDICQLAPDPFQLLMIGNYVAGILIDQHSNVAEYRSISTNTSIPLS